MRRIAFATCSKNPTLTADDRQVLPALQQMGIQVEPLLWNSDSADCSHYDAVVLRSTWDYYLHFPRFLRWIDAFEAAAGPRLFNPPAVVRWNADKTYLRQLEREGTAIAATEWIAPEDARRLGDVLNQRGWDAAVLKPVVSAGAYRTARVSRDDLAAGQAALDALLQAGHQVMLQTFVDEVVSAGEISLIFFGGAFSHAVNKRPQAGDFRSQPDHGGKVEAYIPEPELLQRAQGIVDRYAQGCLYARVDVVQTARGTLLMELELIEPFLYMYTAAGAPQRLAAAIARNIDHRE